MKLKIVCFLIIYSIILISGCGKKLPPTSPDIWPPRVLNVKAENEYHLRVFFSERIDTLSLKRLENFKILNPENSETTSVIYSEIGKKRDDALLTIPKLENVKYSLLIFNIEDIKGNIMTKAERSFKPSQEKDTILPFLEYTKPSRMRTSAPSDSLILLRFSEPMNSLGCGIGDLMLAYIDIDSLFVWNETLTEVNLHYRLVEDKLCKLIILPLFTDLSGNPLGEMRILSLTMDDKVPGNKLCVKVSKNGKGIGKAYAFLEEANEKILTDVISVDTTLSFSFYFTPPDTYLLTILAQDTLDTTGIWWGEKQILFFPDTSRSMDEELEIGFAKREELPSDLMKLYEILKKNIK